MTSALCLECGAIKWGAWTNCSICKAKAGNRDLANQFSDHCLTVATLRDLGAVVAAIRAVESDPDLMKAAFRRHVAERCPVEGHRLKDIGQPITDPVHEARIANAVRAAQDLPVTWTFNKIIRRPTARQMRWLIPYLITRFLFMATCCYAVFRVLRWVVSQHSA
jgi:hypothetical protein